MDQPERDGGHAPLEEHVPAEAVVPVREREVDVTVTFEVGHVAVEQVGEVGPHQRLVDRRDAGHRPDGAVEPQHRRRAECQEEVGAGDVLGGTQHGVQGLVNVGHTMPIDRNCDNFGPGTGNCRVQPTKFLRTE